MSPDERPFATSVPPPALRRPSEVQRIALAVLLGLAAFAVIYLVAANVILRSRWLRDVVSRGPDMQLEYTSAYSVWPGLVHVRGLEMQVQDYAIQLSIGADSGLIRVSLPDLLLKRFHATRVSLAGLSFRLRNKVAPEEAGSARVAAFPPIAGFPDPPVLDGPKPAPVPDAEYKLWQIELEDVRAEVHELWFYEYHYLGAGIARGGFRLQPGRYFAVYPAQVRLDRGDLNIGDALAAGGLVLDVQGHIDPTDVREIETRTMIEKISARVAIDARGVNLAPFDSHTRPRQRPRIAGKADLSLLCSITNGRLDPPSSADLRATEFSFASPIGRWFGSIDSNLKTSPEGRIDWTTTAPLLTLASASGRTGAVLRAPRLAVALESPSLGVAPTVREVDIDVPKLDVPSLGWAKRWIDRAGVPVAIDGRLEGRAHLTLDSERGPRAIVKLRIMDAEMSSTAVHTALRGRVDAELEPVAGGGRNSTGRVDIALDGVEVERIGDNSKPFRAAIRMPDVKLSLGPDQSLSTSVDVYANPADSLLSLALGSPLLEDLAADVFALRRLEARARVIVSEHAVKFELARAQSGALTGTGFWQSPAAGDSRGAFLISSKVANVGISLTGSETETAWFVADDWLSRARTAPRQEPPDQAASKNQPGAKTQAPAGLDRKPGKTAKPREKAPPIAKARPTTKTQPTDAAQPSKLAQPASKPPRRAATAPTAPRSGERKTGAGSAP